jgi:hypothetical protein
MATFGSTWEARVRLLLTPIACGALAAWLASYAPDYLPPDTPVAMRIGLVVLATLGGTGAIFVLMLGWHLLMAPARLDAERERDLAQERARHETAERQMREELERRLTLSRDEHTAATRQLSEAIGLAIGTSARPDAQVAVALSEDIVRDGLGAMGYSDEEVREHASRCFHQLRMFNIRSREAFRQVPRGSVGDRESAPRLSR